MTEPRDRPPPSALEVICGWALIEAARTTAVLGATPPDDANSSTSFESVTRRGAALMASGWARDKAHAPRVVAVEAAKAALAANDPGSAAATLGALLESEPTCFECLQLLEAAAVMFDLSTDLQLTAPYGQVFETARTRYHRLLNAADRSKAPSNVDVPPTLQLGLSGLAESREFRRPHGFTPPTEVMNALSAVIGGSEQEEDTLSALLATAGSDLVAVDVAPPTAHPFGPTNPQCAKVTIPLSVAARRLTTSSWPHYINIGHSRDANSPYHRPLHRFASALDPARQMIEAALDAPARQVNLWLGAAGERVTTSQRHADPYDNVYVVLAGTKVVRLASPGAVVETVAPIASVGPIGLHVLWAPEGASPRPPIEAALFDRRLDQSSSGSGLNESVVTLQAGDALFIPAGWFHQVTSSTDEASKSATCSAADTTGCGVGVHAAINFWFDPPDL